MRCPRCRNRPIPLRRFLLMSAEAKEAITCETCAASLVREPMTTLGEGLLVWLGLMGPLLPVTLAPGVFTLLATLSLYALAAQLAPWEGLRYRPLLPEQDGGLPEARLIARGAPAAGERRAPS